MRGRPVVLIGDTTTGIPLTITGRMYMRRRDRPDEPDQPPEGTPPGHESKAKYEYTTAYVPHSHHHPDVIAKMNELGAEGWLLVAASSGYLYFVRELK